MLIASDNSYVVNVTGNNSPFFIGSEFGSTLFYDASIAELVIYFGLPSLSDKIKIESYLALKYGLTLSSNTDGDAISFEALEGDYLNSAGATIWDASVNQSYHNNIIGIGRDDLSSLLQKQSRTIDDSTRLYLSALASTGQLNTGTFTIDNSSIIVGNNAGKVCATLGSITEVPSGLTSCAIHSRIEREWKVQTTNVEDQIFNMDFKLNNCAIPSSVNISDLRLLVDDDGDFSNGGTTCYYNGDGTGVVISYANPTVTISGITNAHIPNNNTRYLTLASVNKETPLPIDLLNFNAKVLNDNVVKLNWQTASEINNDYFTVERSKSGLEWEELIKIDGAGNSTILLDYSTFDNGPYKGLSYYRLKQTDFDGQFEYSQIEPVNINQENNVQIFPNPTSGLLNLYATPDELKDVVIYNAIGQNVTVLTKQAMSGENMLTIDLSNLSAGMYYVKTRTTSDKVFKE